MSNGLSLYFNNLAEYNRLKSGDVGGPGLSIGPRSNIFFAWMPIKFATSFTSALFPDQIYCVYVPAHFIRIKGGDMPQKAFTVFVVDDDASNDFQTSYRLSKSWEISSGQPGSSCRTILSE